MRDVCKVCLYIFLVTDVNVGNRMDQASIVVVRGGGGKAYKKGPAQEKKKWSSSSYPVHIQHTYKERKKIKPIIFLCWKKEKVGGG